MVKGLTAAFFERYVGKIGIQIDQLEPVGYIRGGISIEASLRWPFLFMYSACRARRYMWLGGVGGLGRYTL